MAVLQKGNKRITVKSNRRISKLVKNDGFRIVNGSDDKLLKDYHAENDAIFLAKQMNVSLSEINGTGKDGKILISDVKNYKNS